MSDVDIPALVERVRDMDAKATKGPWTEANEGRSVFDAVGTICINFDADTMEEEEHHIHDMRLIALYRTAAPVLADEVERLRVVLTQCRLEFACRDRVVSDAANRAMLVMIDNVLRASERTGGA